MREDSGINAFIRPLPESEVPGFKLVRSLPVTLQPRTLYCVKDDPYPGENYFISNNDGSQATHVLLQAIPAKIDNPPLTGHWHHGNGVLVSGGIRIAREDFDTNPPEPFKKEVFDWICKVLNKEVDLYYRTKKDDFIDQE